VADYEGFKKYGFLRQQGTNTFALRLRTIAGDITAEQVRRIAELAEKYAGGQLHITTRQGIEIPGINIEDIPKIRAEVEKLGLKIGGLGNKVRSVVSCQGSERCRHGITPCKVLAGNLDRRFFGREAGMKVKIAVSGCPNSCTRPVENDIGVMGVVEPVHDDEACLGCGYCPGICSGRAIEMYENLAVRDTSRCLGCGKCIEGCPNEAWLKKSVGYHVFVGGKAGLYPKQGVRIVSYLSGEEVPGFIEAILSAAQKLMEPGERIGGIVERIGPGVFSEKVYEIYQALRNTGAA